MCADGKDKKRESLYEAVISLMEKGEDQATMKVSDIAEAANMGKSTVYEYFSSREELIARTVIYYINRYLKEAESIFDRELGFRNRVLGICDIINKEAKRSAFFVDILLSTGNVSEIYSIFKKADLTVDFEKDIHEYIIRLIEDGKKEGIIASNAEIEFASFVVQASIGGYVGIQHNQKFSAKEKKQRKDYVYDMIVKSLSCD